MRLSIILRRAWACYDTHVALEDVSLSFEGPGVVQVVGPNGAGKTTLLRVIAGLHEPCRGEVYVGGSRAGSPEARRRVFLASDLDWAGHPVTVGEAISIVSRAYSGGEMGVDEAVEAVGIPGEKLDSPIWGLSAGERRRLLIAMALASGRDILLLDEPLTALDARSRGIIEGLLEGLAREKTLVVTGHEPLERLRRLGPLVLLNKRIVGVSWP